MAKKIIGNLKLRIPAGRATAGPPVGSTLGQWGLNMMDFINPFNEATKGMMGKDVIVHLQVYEDRTFTWNCLGQPVDDLIHEKVFNNVNRLSDVFLNKINSDFVKSFL